MIGQANCSTDYNIAGAPFSLARKMAKNRSVRLCLNINGGRQKQDQHCFRRSVLHRALAKMPRRNRFREARIFTRAQGHRQTATSRERPARFIAFITADAALHFLPRSNTVLDQSDRGAPFLFEERSIGAPAHGRYLSFHHSNIAHAANAILNSNIFYLYFIVFGDCFHLSDTLVSNFPIPTCGIDG